MFRKPKPETSSSVGVSHFAYTSSFTSVLKHLFSLSYLFWCEKTPWMRSKKSTKIQEKKYNCFLIKHKHKHILYDTYTELWIQKAHEKLKCWSLSSSVFFLFLIFKQIFKVLLIYMFSDLTRSNYKYLLPTVNDVVLSISLFPHLRQVYRY